MYVLIENYKACQIKCQCKFIKGDNYTDTLPYKHKHAHTRTRTHTHKQTLKYSKIRQARKDMEHVKHQVEIKIILTTIMVESLCVYPVLKKKKNLLQKDHSVQQNRQQTF